MSASMLMALLEAGRAPLEVARPRRRSGPDLDPRRKHHYRALGVTATCAVCSMEHHHHKRSKRRSYLPGSRR